MAVYRGSRYVQTSLFMKKDTPVLGIRQRNKFDLTDATYYTVVQGDTLDGISYKHYDNAQLGWAILDANPNFQSELDIRAGDILCIPPFEEVVKVCE